MVTITLSKEELSWCLDHAKKIVAHYGGEGSRGSGAYNHNKVSSNIIGVKSEVALVKWFRSHSVAPIIENYQHFKKTNLKGDLQVSESQQPVEVKGLRPHQWKKFQRMIPPRQLGHYVRDKSIVVWTTTVGDAQDGEVRLRGWNYAWEVQEFGVPIKTICDNIWLKEDDMMRPMHSILNHIENPIIEW